MIFPKETFVNTLHPRDYEDIKFGVEIAQSAINLTILARGCPVVIACEQRWWEYGSAIQMLLNSAGMENIGKLDILDVGSGWSGLGPAINLTWDANVVEYEPIDQYRIDRERTNQIIRSYGKKGTRCLKEDLKLMPGDQFDAVFCISVLEHVAKADEKKCWVNLADRVKPGGLLFITCDVVDDNSKPHIYDEMRVMPNYTLQDMRERVEMLIDCCKMHPYGIPDYKYNGDMVHDFTFFRAGFIKG